MTASLLGRLSENQPLKDGSSLFTNFIKFCVSFSLIHASVNSVLAFSSTLLGPSLGSVGSAVLYLAYSFSTLFMSQTVLARCGPKWTVFLGLSGLQIYVLSFFVALLIPDVKWVVFIVGAAVGGCGGGIIWVGQSMYYSANATAYSNASKTECVSISISKFSAYFAFFYLGFEVILQLLALSVSVFDAGTGWWQIIVFGTGSSFAVIGSIIMYFVGDLYPDDSSIGTNSRRGGVWQSMKYITRTKRLLLLLPFQICIGLSSGLVNYFVNRYVVAATYNDGYVGLVMALDTMSSAVAVYPVTYASEKLSKSSMIILGCSIYIFHGCLVVFMSDSELAQWEILIPLFVTHGVSRCVWEGVNKAFVSENFIDTQQREDAFMAIYFSSGISAGISFLCYFYMSKFQFSLLNLCWSVFALFCWFLNEYGIWASARTMLDGSKPLLREESSGRA